MFIDGMELVVVNRNISRQEETSITAHILQDLLNPFPWYQMLRAQHPVYFSREFNSWFITRYQDAQRIINDTAHFSSQQSIRSRVNASSGKTAPTLLWMDPPRHRQLRSLIGLAFTPRTILALAPRITEIMQMQLDAVISHGTMDVIQDIANPLPIIVIAELVGVPVADQQQFKFWSDIIVSPVRQAKKQAVIEMNGYLQSIIAQRRQQPQDDLISTLLAAQIDGDRLSEAEILSFCRLLLVAGHETSTNLIGNALLTLDEHPDVLEELSNNTDLLPVAIEEIIRYRTPIQRLRRAVVEDILLDDHEIKAGSIISPVLGAANRDEDYFIDPERFDIHRTPNRHLGFGHGIHYCIGASLAKLETRIALEVLLTRCAGLRRMNEHPLEPVTSSFVYGVKHLPMIFTERM